MSASQNRWLLLIHNIPPKPSYFRVKVWRRLQRLGAVAIKNSVYVLPNSDSSLEAFEWVLREIIQGKGEATLCQANFVEGLNDDRIEGLFHQARDAEYEALAEETRRIIKGFRSKSKLTDEKRKQLEADLTRLKRRLSEIIGIDFFGSPRRVTAEGYIHDLGKRLQSKEPGCAVVGNTSVRLKDLEGRTWVTRKGIHVDRMASAWLIRRFIDPKASFKFVDGKTYHPENRELRFDMFEAEFTHEGDSCTFEVLIKRVRLNDPALSEIAEIIHDIDLKDEKFSREDALGIERLIAGICMAHREDEARLTRGAAVFEDLYEYFKRKGKRGSL